jgi:hypothetical protein
MWVFAIPIEHAFHVAMDFAAPWSRIEAAGPFPKVGIMRVAAAHGDGAGMNVAVVDVPAILAVGRAAAGKLGHRGIEARAGELGKHARRLSLIVWAVGAWCGMEKTIERVLSLMMPGVAAIAVALTLGYIAHYDFGLSRVEIRTPALVGAGIIAVLVAVEFFGKKLRRAKWLERDIGPRWAPLFSKKIPQSRQLNDVVRRQNRANQISLRHCVNFIQMTLRFGLQHKLPDALVEGAFDDHVGTRAKGGANALLVEWRPFSKRCGSTKINSAIGHAGIEAQDMA